MKIYRKINRRRRTNIILTVISSVFFVSWAPLNILNVVINTANPFEVKLTQKRDSLQHLSSQRRLWLLLMEFVTSLVIFLQSIFKHYQTFKTSHISLLGMSSALTNPLLYGLLNTNFRRAAHPSRRRYRNVPMSTFVCL